MLRVQLSIRLHILKNIFLFHLFQSQPLVSKHIISMTTLLKLKKSYGWSSFISAFCCCCWSYLLCFPPNPYFGAPNNYLSPCVGPVHGLNFLLKYWSSHCDYQCSVIFPKKYLASPGERNTTATQALSTEVLICQYLWILSIRKLQNSILYIITV